LLPASPSLNDGDDGDGHCRGGGRHRQPDRPHRRKVRQTVGAGVSSGGGHGRRRAAATRRVLHAPGGRRRRTAATTFAPSAPRAATPSSSPWAAARPMSPGGHRRRARCRHRPKWDGLLPSAPGERSPYHPPLLLYPALSFAQLYDSVATAAVLCITFSHRVIRGHRDVSLG
jgi:hypothetical protein